MGEATAKTVPRTDAIGWNDPWGQRTQSAETVIKTSSFEQTKIRLTIEQVRELQEMVSRAMSEIRTGEHHAVETTFRWNAPGLGELWFRVATQRGDVQVDIRTVREDVASAIEQNRPLIEGVVADAGLRLQRLEVTVGETQATMPGPDGSANRQDAQERTLPQRAPGNGRPTTYSVEDERSRAPRSADWTGRSWLA